MDAIETIKELAHGFANAAVGEEFFKSLVRYLAKSLAVDYVFIGEVLHEQRAIQPVAFFSRGELMEAKAYPIAGSLCAYVIEPRFCAFPSGVQEQFPDNQAIKHFGVESYAGMPLLDSGQNVLGLIYVMHSKAITNLEYVESLLSIVAKRAELELERMQREQQLQARNQSLMQVNDELARTQQALLEANQQLEQRVSQRTSELQANEEELRQSLEQLEQLNRTLTEREAFLASIINQTGVGIALVNHQERFTFANEGYCNIVGRPFAELQQLTLRDITHPDDLPNNLVLLKELVEVGQWFELEKRYLRPDGSVVWCLINVSQVEPVAGQPLGIMAVCQDITRRKEAEASLVRTEERFQLVSRATNDIIWDWDLLTNKVWWNEGFKTNFGYRTEEIEPDFNSWYSRIHPDDRDQTVNGIHQVINLGGKQWSGEYRFRRADGTYAYIYDRGYVLYTGEGKPYRMLGSMLDLTERKKADEALAKLSADYQFLANSVPTIVWRTDPNGNHEYFNQRWYEYSGLTYEQSRDEGWVLVLHPDDYERTLQVWHAALQTGSNYQIEYRFRRFDGVYRWFLGQAVPFRDKDGTILKWFGTCTDIHDQKNTEKALYQSRQQERLASAEVERQRQFLHQLFSQLPAIVGVQRGPDFVYELANDTLRKIVGERDFLGKTMQEVFPEIEPRLLSIHRKVFETGERYVGESIPIRLDWADTAKATVKYFNFVYEPFRNEKGQVDGIISFGYEVTNQVRARQVLERREAQMRLILESIPHLAWTSWPEAETGITFFNKRWYEYTGLDEEKSVGMGWLQALHPDDVQAAIERRSVGRSRGESYEVENRYRRHDGEYRWHLGRIVPIRDKHGKIIMWVGTATDIHDQKIAQYALENTLKELHEKNFELDQFVYKTSHDLRAPLTTIMGLVDILKLESDEAAKARYVDLIESRVLKLDTFIKSMLDYSRNTRTATRYETVNVEALLQECISELEYMRHFDRLQIRTHIEATELHADIFRLKIIFSNLVSNAVKYQDFTKGQSTLDIQVRPAGEQIVITFTDNGVGIDPAYQDRIFNMFFRAAEQSEGSGLGLYIVKQAASVLNGTVLLKSEAGVGTEFVVTLPGYSII